MPPIMPADCGNGYKPRFINLNSDYPTDNSKMQITSEVEKLRQENETLKSSLLKLEEMMLYYQAPTNPHYNYNYNSISK